MAFDAHKNLAYSSVASPPSPAASGVTLILQTGEGTRFPAAPFPTTIWPAGAIPVPTNAEIAYCTAKSGDTLTLIRAQEGSSARTIIAGDQVIAGITVKSLTDIENTLVPASRSEAGTGAIAALALPPGTGDLVIYMNNTTIATIQGIAAGLSWQRLRVFSGAAGGLAQVDFSHQDATAAAANRMVLVATSGKTSLAPGSGIADFVYDPFLGRWRLVAHEQGGWIYPAYNASDWSAATGTWTVSAGAILTDGYYLKGRTLQWAVSVSGTSVSATPSNLRRVAYGYTITKRFDCPIVTNDNALGVDTGTMTCAAAGPRLEFYKKTGTWAVAASTTAILSSGQIEVT